MAIDYRVANDNVPKRGTSEAPATGSFNPAGAALRAKIFTPKSNTDDTVTVSAPSTLMDYTPVWAPAAKSAADSPFGFGLKAGLTAWILSVAGAGWAIYAGAPGIFHLVAALAVMWASIVIGYFMSKRESRAGVELSALSALLAFAGTLYVIAAHFGLLAPPALMAATLAGGALALGLVLRSQIGVRLAAILGIAWLAASLISGHVSLLFWLIPAFAGITLLSAASQDDEAAFNLSHILLYGWLAAALALAVTGGIVPAIYAAALFFGIAAAQRRIGRMMQDTAHPMGEPTAAWGWTLSMASLIGITDFWLRGDAMPWAMGSLDPVGLALFVGLALCALTLILLTEIRRVVTRPQSPGLALSIAIIIGAVMFAPLYAPALAQTDMVSLTEMGLSTSQGVGLLFAGAAFALSCIYAVNGARRVQPLRVVAALLALAGLAVVALDHLLITPEALLIFGAAVFVSLVTAIGFIKPRA